jgi:hypothetical protein
MILRASGDGTMMFACAVCRVPITNNVEELHHLDALSEEDGQPHLPAGVFYIPQADDDLRRPVGDVVVNISDLTNTKPHELLARRSGCCGPHGGDGFNVVCLNGHEVGTERSDCWMSHFVVLAASHVVQLQ